MGVTLFLVPVFFKAVMSSVQKEIIRGWWSAEHVIVTEKIKVLSAIFTKSSCPLIWGCGQRLWPRCVKLYLRPPLRLPPLLSSVPLFTALCGSGRVATPSGLQSSGQGL